MSYPHQSTNLKDDDKIVDPEADVHIIAAGGQVEEEVDQAYMSASKSTRMFRSVLVQMILFGALAFVGPAMSDAISNLGGGGLKSPYLANLATSLNYALSTVVTLVGGPIINKIGIKWACILAALTFPLAGSGYYAQARFQLSAYLLTARAVGGIGSGLLYVGESTAMLSYPSPDERGRMLAIWAGMRNSGSVIGGAINFANNYDNASAGLIRWSTYLIFIAFESTGIIWALLLTKTSKVRRKSGVPVPMSEEMSWKREFVALYKHLQNKRTWLIFIPAFYSFFCGGVYGTYLSLHFSVRSRALSSLLQPICSIVTLMAFGALLDYTKWSQKKRAWISLVVWVIPQAAALIWTGVNYHRFTQVDGTIAYDYKLHGATWASYYLPYLLVFTSSYWVQIHLYWTLGTFSSDVKSSSRTGGLFRAFETAGQAVSYAINANTGDKKIPLYIMSALLAGSLVCMSALIRLVPARPVNYDDVADKKRPGAEAAELAERS